MSEDGAEGYDWLQANLPTKYLGWNIINAAADWIKRLRANADRTLTLPNGTVVWAGKVLVHDNMEIRRAVRVISVGEEGFLGREIAVWINPETGQKKLMSQFHANDIARKKTGGRGPQSTPTGPCQDRRQGSNGKMSRL